jgi:hypothetical protein
MVKMVELGCPKLSKKLLWLAGKSLSVLECFRGVSDARNVWFIPKTETESDCYEVLQKVELKP